MLTRNVYAMDDAAELERLRAKEAARLARNADYMRRYRAKVVAKKAAAKNAIVRKVLEQVEERAYVKRTPSNIQIGPVTPPPGSRLKKGK